ncbi:cupin domain-containing protein [Micromonospora sp. DR5-3]|uniref:cupin domain-containing protein n=1 Tax=unclassified Micromonospora TaxID=2617518 RepID=UPI0011D6AFD3|nr:MULTISPECIES: cupin domain-containing protein [unclassified Micromonospora]MCW3815852.1 cupin domain-containing protein [Micromonospora sp. DR5-3]TYC24368.1 cupin domain-containing protein [Micromonospora sp. MP36]
MTESPVTITATDDPGQPVRTPELEELYRGFEKELLVPLWTEIGDLMPAHPHSHAQPYCWRWNSLLPLAAQAGELVPVGRGGERRAIALANPGLGGRPFATPTLWAAIQYLNPGEDAPVHRHTQNAFRFVVEGEGVWTVVNGDPVAMRRGDFLPQAGWHWHGHHNRTDRPMAWIDGLDIPLQYYADSTFFEFGPDEVETRDAPERSYSERLWAHPGLRPLTQLQPTPATPLLAYRWEHTDRALTEQLALEAEGYSATVEPGHAAVRYTNPTTGGDIMPTIRTEFHRLAPDTGTATRREVGSSVYQVFQGSGQVTVGAASWTVERGDLFVVPSWQPLTITTDGGLDLFRFSDTPVFERLHQDRVQIDNREGIIQ